MTKFKFNFSIGEGENFRKELDSNRTKGEQLQHENKIRIRTFQEELERVKIELTKKATAEEKSTDADIDVIHSVDGAIGSKSLDRSAGRKSTRGVNLMLTKDIKSVEKEVRPFNA